MVIVILLCCAMIGDDPKPRPATPADRAAYESAQTKAGSDAAAHVAPGALVRGARLDAPNA